MAIEQSLAGRCIAITRPAAQAASLARAIEAAGGRALRFPVIEIAPLEDSTELAAATADLERFSLAFFVSPNAVEQALAYILPRRTWPPALAVATVGQGSEAALARAGLGPVVAARGARVRHVTCYRRRIPAADPAPLLAAARAGQLDALVLTSSEGVGNLLSMVGEAGRATLAGVPVFVPHPRIAEAARRAGFATVVATGPGDTGVLAALQTHLGCAGSP